MTQGRLYKSARAVGPTADDAILAMPERVEPVVAQSDAPDWHVPTAFNAADADEGKPVAEVADAVEAAVEAVPAISTISVTPSTPAAHVQPARADVSDYDHIFATPDLTIAEPDEDLFPWETASDAARPAATSSGSHAHSAAPAATPVAGAGFGTTSAAKPVSPQPTRLRVDGPQGVVEGTNNPVSTYLAKAPRIRLTFAGAAAAIGTVTVGLGFIEALLSDHIGLVTAVLSIATALAATWLVGDRDCTAPALLLPVAWFVCAVLPGQFTAPPSGSLALKQIVVVLGVLGDNAVAIILGTIACYLLGRVRPRLIKDPLV
jgi:hypothetical protein